MKKRGFTLIELLAVIVVLAIIALIATPIVMNVIEKSKKGAAERSAENYVDAVETKVVAERVNGNILEGEYIIDSSGDLTGNGLTEPLKIEMSGNKPISGTIVIENGSVVSKSSDSNSSLITTMLIGDYTVSYDSNGIFKAYNDIKIEQIIIEYPTAYYESNGAIVYNSMTTVKDYEPKITIVPGNATNKKLEFEIEKNWQVDDTIDTTTGVISHKEPKDTGMQRCTSVYIIAKALDGSGVTGKITLKTKTEDVSKCYIMSPWQ